MMILITQLIQLISDLWQNIKKHIYEKINGNIGMTRKCEEKLHGTIEVPFIKGFPVVGTLFDFIKAGGASKLHEYIDERHQRNGDIFREKLVGNQNVVFVASASLIKSIFQYEGQHPKHPLPEAWLLYNKKHKQSRGIFFMEGEEWQKYRRFLHRHLLKGNLDWIKENIEICNENLIEIWRNDLRHAPDKAAIEIQDIEFQLYRWSIQVICTIMFGCSVQHDPEVNNTLNNFAKIVCKIFKSSSALMSFPPSIAKRLNLRIWTRFENDVTQVLQEGSTLINMLIENYENSEETEKNTLYEKFKESNVSLDVVKRIFIDFVIAAADTTAYSTEWALYLLARDKCLQEKLLNSNGKRNLDMIHGFIKETLRLYPVAPFIGRYLETDADIEGYKIKKGTLVVISLYTSGRKKEHFSKPFQVKPERWKQLTECSGQENHQAHASIPFGIGNRSCIGRRIALYQLESFIGLMVESFILKIKNINELKPILRLVTVPNEQLELYIKRR